MPEQIRMMELDAPRQIAPDKQRQWPVVWVRELRLMRELKADGEVIRTITLQPCRTWNVGESRTPVVERLIH